MGQGEAALLLELAFSLAADAVGLCVVRETSLEGLYSHPVSLMLTILLCLMVKVTSLERS